MRLHGPQTTTRPCLYFIGFTALHTHLSASALHALARTHALAHALTRFSKNTCVYRQQLLRFGAGHLRMRDGREVDHDSGRGFGGKRRRGDGRRKICEIDKWKWEGPETVYTEERISYWRKRQR